MTRTCNCGWSTRRRAAAGYIRLQMLVGQLYAQLEDYERAAAAMQIVFKALGEPDAYGLKGRMGMVARTDF